MTDDEVLSRIQSDFDLAGKLLDELILAIEKRFPEALDPHVIHSQDMGKGLLTAYRDLKDYLFLPLAQPAVPEMETINKGNFCPHCGFRHPPDGMCLS